MTLKPQMAAFRFAREGDQNGLDPDKGDIGQVSDGCRASDAPWLVAEDNIPENPTKNPPPPMAIANTSPIIKGSFDFFFGSSSSTSSASAMTSPDFSLAVLYPRLANRLLRGLVQLCAPGPDRMFATESVFGSTHRPLDRP